MASRPHSPNVHPEAARKALQILPFCDFIVLDQMLGDAAPGPFPPFFSAAAGAFRGHYGHPVSRALDRGMGEIIPGRGQ